MILGTGVDVAPIARVARLVNDHAGDLGRMFTARERAFCDAGAPRQRDARYAAAFAAKEAVVKALGTGWQSDVEGSDIDTGGRDRNGAVTLTGAVARAAARLGVGRVIVSMSTTREAAVASAVAEKHANA